MSTLTDKVQDFLAQDRIAVAGVSRSAKGAAANSIYLKLKSSGHTVFAINPNAETVAGDPAYPDLAAIPGGVTALMIATRPEVTEQLVKQAADTGVSRVWMHHAAHSFGTSVSPAAVQFCQEHRIACIAGACPMMYCQPVDFGHKCMKFFLGVGGKLPE